MRIALPCRDGASGLEPSVRTGYTSGLPVNASSRFATMTCRAAAVRIDSVAHYLAWLLLFAAPAWAAPPSEPVTRADVVYWCYYQMGEFGSEAVDVCVNEEFAAAQALAAYPSSRDGIRSQCERRAGSRGLSATRTCMEDEIAANAKLDAYPAAAAERIAACRARFATGGSAAVVRCVDDPSVPTR